ncbi:hypothetical protein EZV62_003318 [Acer yangbiense]|uniref:PGG domain-containing protein n=1 Tax=Acer yangbiense TaxID=1000413 RepID=A0A5C7IGL1_9ROSI|nr:hypothetical protein EZV62_003318 [Acer yangbiense]
MIGDSGSWNYEKAIDFLKEPAFAAVRLGIYEVVNEVLKAYIGLVSFTEELGYHMLSWAVLFRQEKAFNLVYQVCHPMVRGQLTMGKNVGGDTILHIATVLAPSSEIPRCSIADAARVAMVQGMLYFYDLLSYQKFYVILTFVLKITELIRLTSNFLVSQQRKSLIDMEPNASRDLQMKDLQKIFQEVQIELKKKKIIERNVDVARYLPLYRAIREKKWKRVEDFVANNPEALHDDITETGENIFHFLGQFNEAIGLVNKFLIKVPPESLERTNIEGVTALATAALSGNTEAAKAFVNKNKKLLSMNKNDLSKKDIKKFLSNKNNPPSRKDMEKFVKEKLECNGERTFLPVHAAAYCSRKETVEYLISETAKVVDLTQDSGGLLLKILINSNLFGTALDLLEQYPQLASNEGNRYWNIFFEIMVTKPQIYESGSRLGFWRSFIYRCIPLQEEKNPYPLPKRVGGDIEIQTDRFQCCSAESKPSRFLQATFGKLIHKANIMLWKPIMLLAPKSIRKIHDQKLTHKQTLAIVRKMIGDSGSWNYEKAIDFLKEPAFTAVSLGIYEVVNEILMAYIGLVSFTNELGYHMLSLAVKHRQEKVFNLLYEVCHPMVRDQLTMGKNIGGDTILHIAAVLAPSSEIPGAALQMQHELQWFKVIIYIYIDRYSNFHIKTTMEECFHQSLQRKHNLYRKTPREEFTKTHSGLVEKGEKWMKDTATSCSVVAALIITIVFTAAFTVPGGTDSHGRPNFLHELSFKIFAISVALALFSSTASVQMFLGILTSRYAEDDFLFSLPKQLIIGLITLFFSIASMMVAFAATFCIVISYPWRWVTFLIASLGAVPVTLFAWMQFPLLVDIFISTYGAGIYKPIKTKDVYM